MEDRNGESGLENGSAVKWDPLEDRWDLEMVEERPHVQAIAPEYRRRACEACGHSEVGHFSLMLGSRSHICHREGRFVVVLWPEES